MPRIQRALLSVSNKEGILELAQFLVSIGTEILSTGRTAQLLQAKGINAREVSNYTGQPEILDGRVKTLHPKIYGGILAMRSNKGHLQEIEELGIPLIDLVVVNLYPFEETIQKKNVTLQEAIENVDIGGPTMLRAAAKNWQDVAVVCDPTDYPAIIEELKRKKGQISEETSFRLAKKVFALTARYDGAIASYFSGGREGKFPETFSLQAEKVQDLRYGENPHQRATFYRLPSPPVGESFDFAQDAEPVEAGLGVRGGITNAHQLHGKELSFNNILDLDAAIGLVREFEEPACVIVKHTNPCGVAALTPGPSPVNGRGVFIAARSCDSLSAFGGIIAINREIDGATAEEIAKDFYECVVAPRFSKEALEILKGKKNIRLMELPPSPQPSSTGGEGGYDIKKVSGGLLVQERDQLTENIREAKIVSKRKPADEEWQALDFAWKVVMHVKSNAIVLAGYSPPSPVPSTSSGTASPARGEAKLLCTFGIGAGQMSRVDSVKSAIAKMTSPPSPLLNKERGARGEVCLASDAFFPFRDNVDEAVKAGIKAIIQPGGSLKDQESIDAANEHQIAMLFTGVRHFRH